MHIVLFEPKIPPNTGNIVRLCAVTNTELHLIEPLGFTLSDKLLKRAGLDYWEYAHIHTWPHFTAYAERYREERRFVMTSSKGSMPLQHFDFTPQDSLIFGSETAGLSKEVLEQEYARVRIPMRPNVRCLNLATSAGIVLYAALAQCGLLEEWS